MRKRKIIILVIVGILLITGIVFFVALERNRFFPSVSSVNASEVISSQSLNSVPQDLSNLLNFDGVKPYGIKKEIFSNGIQQYTLKYNTSHLFGNYAIINYEMANTNGFVPQTVPVFSNDFYLVFNKENMRLSVAATEDTSNLREPNVITMVLTEPNNTNLTK